MTATLDVQGNRSTLRFERLLGHGRDRVWQAVTDSAELAQWFPAAVAYEPRVGAPMQFDFGGQHGLDVWPGEVLEWDPPRVFAFLWGKDELRFELADAADGTRLVFTHSFPHEPGKPGRDAAGWAACLESLDAVLDGREKPGPDTWRKHADTYAEEFGRLSVDGRPVTLTGPYQETDGHATVSVDFNGAAGTLVVTDAGQPLTDGATVEIRDEGGATLAAGTLHDPLVRSAQRRTG
jgi:uncharacterized protein YndB with AHSA1/START domain